ncbi:MAG TPA: DUF1801 domain-containing protein [Clostridia bacterium]|nr:MAG: hypothetical protein BWX97_02230 [Firmicutes bacterium ADurb.Bin146]HOD92610.1 DUF1801 domain-containing protein [Clostridia bacterium]HQM39476.1 DUF1801 domain-containing protein [Clostridia bacterium]
MSEILKPYQTVDEYMQQLPEDTLVFMLTVRETLQKTLPQAKEKISWSMPTFWDKKNIIHFAAHKNHMGLYPGVDAIIHFAYRLKGYKTSKGAIQFKYNEKIPLDLIADIAKWCYETGNHP